MGDSSVISSVWISLYSKSGGIMILCEHAHLTPLSTVNNTWAQVYILNFPAILTSHTKIIQNVLFIFCLCKHNDNYSSAWQQNVGYESCVFCNKLLLLSHSFTYVMIFFFFFTWESTFLFFKHSWLVNTKVSVLCDTAAALCCCPWPLVLMEGYQNLSFLCYTYILD